MTEAISSRPAPIRSPSTVVGIVGQVPSSSLPFMPFSNGVYCFRIPGIGLGHAARQPDENHGVGLGQRPATAARSCRQRRRRDPCGKPRLEEMAAGDGT